MGQTIHLGELGNNNNIIIKKWQDTYNHCWDNRTEMVTPANLLALLMTNQIFNNQRNSPKLKQLSTRNPNHDSVTS